MASQEGAVPWCCVLAHSFLPCCISLPMTRPSLRHLFPWLPITFYLIFSWQSLYLQTGVAQFMICVLRLKKNTSVGSGTTPALCARQVCEWKMDLFLQDCEHQHLTAARFSLPPVADTGFRGRAQSHPPLWSRGLKLRWNYLSKNLFVFALLFPECSATVAMIYYFFLASVQTLCSWSCGWTTALQQNNQGIPLHPAISIL